MKYILILFFSFLVLLEVNSQQLDGNSCTANLKTTFLDTKSAAKKFKNHGNTTREVNLVLSRDWVKYNGSQLDDIEDVSDAIFQSESLPSTFHVFIGVRFDVPSEYLAKLLCEINKISTHKIDSISVYFYDM